MLSTSRLSHMLWAAVLLWGVHAQVAGATPLRLEYTVGSVGPGLYDYEFKLILDHHDGTWNLGENFNWITFGDSAVPADGPDGKLDGFAGDPTDPPIGPVLNHTNSSGAHNGPTLLGHIPNANDGGWNPTAVGQFLTWSGTSTALLGQGQLLFSNLIGDGGYATFETAVMIGMTAVPEPAALVLFGIGLASLAAYRRRKR